MITRTANGYALNQWEAQPMLLPNGTRLTAGEARALVCRANGMTHKEAAQVLNCSENCIKQYWASIYFKTHTHRFVLALNALTELGALRARMMLFIAILLTGWIAPGAGIDQDNTPQRISRTQRAGRRGRGARRGRSVGSADLLTADLTFWTSGNAAEIYTHADIRGAA